MRSGSVARSRKPHDAHPRFLRILSFFIDRFGGVGGDRRLRIGRFAGDRPAPALTTEKIAAIVASPDRSAADRANDVRRKPVDMLDFIGIRPGMIALDVSAGGGYTTELLARAVGPTGRVYGQSAPVRRQLS